MGCRIQLGRVSLRASRYGAIAADLLSGSKSFLLSAERVHWVCRGCAAGRQVAGQQSSEEKNQPHYPECGEIHCADAEQHGSHGSAYEVGANQTNDQADAGEQEALFYYMADHAIAAGAESHAQSDLMRALGYGEGHHTVDAYGSE
jgi:hypothetical protein